MAKLLVITVKETREELTDLLKKRVNQSSKPRLRMLLSIVDGIVSTNELVSITKANRDSIRNWKNTYNQGGLDALLGDDRGGKRPAAINAANKVLLGEKLSNPKDGFTSYKQAVEWINDHFGLKMNYHAVNKYLKRNFGTKLKVGRKSHVSKDDKAAALFKKTTRDLRTY